MKDDDITLVISFNAVICKIFGKNTTTKKYQMIVEKSEKEETRKV